MRWAGLIALAIAAACKNLPHELPDAAACGNHVVDPGEVCDWTPDTCIPPGSPDACQLQCATAPCPGGWTCDARHVCERPAGFDAAWSGGLAFSGQAFEVTSFDPNVDAFLDLIGADAAGVHVRRGDGTGAFGPVIDLPYPSACTGVVALRDFDGDGIVDVIAATATGAVVLHADGSGGLQPALTVPTGNGETILAIVVLHQTTIQTNWLTLIVQTPTGRVLRNTPQSTSGGLSAFETAPPVLADLPVPVIAGAADTWLAVAPTGGMAAVNEIPALRSPPDAGMWLGPSGAVVTAMYIEKDPPILYISSTGGVFTPWASLSTTPAQSNAAWAEGPGTLDGGAATPVPLIGFVSTDGQLTFAFDGGSSPSPLAPIPAPFAATAVRSGDVDRDGLSDLVLGDGANVVVMRGKGHLSP